MVNRLQKTTRKFSGSAVKEAPKDSSVGNSFGFTSDSAAEKLTKELSVEPNAVRASIQGLGTYLPEKVRTNNDFTKFLDTSDEWIVQRTGIKTRRVAAPDQATSDLCVEASRQAISEAGLEPTEIDLIITTTSTPDFVAIPATACVVQKKLGLSSGGCGSMDLGAACTGFIYGLATAKAYVESRMAKNVLVVGGEVLSRVSDYNDRKTCILFGDGAGAAVVGAATKARPGRKIGQVELHADGDGEHLAKIPAGGVADPASTETLENGKHFLQLAGREIFRFGVKCLSELITSAMERNNWSVDDIGLIVPHQANKRIFDTVSERLNLPEGKIYCNIDKYGNTSSASIPIALAEAVENGSVEDGKPILLIGFGGGLTWGMAVLY